MDVSTFEGMTDEDIQQLDDDEYEAYLAWAAREAADDIYVGRLRGKV